MRLDKYLCEALNITRKQAHIRIRGGDVALDGVVIKKLATQVPEGGVVTLNGDAIELSGPRYLMLNKPQGYVCVTTDNEHPTVLDLIPVELQRDLHPAGRLDIDTTGLVLLSSDGKWTHRITSPRHHCSKVYIAELAQPLLDGAETQFAEGLLLRGESKPTKPAILEPLANDCARVTITEGRYHQVKRMFAAIGNRVVALHRQQIGNVVLDTGLAEGEFRHLSEDEIACFGGQSGSSA